MNYSFEEAQRQAELEYGFSVGSNDNEWLTKFPLGETKFRLLTPLFACPQHFKEGWAYNGICVGKDNGCEGCKQEVKHSMKWLGLVWHEGKIKPALLPHKVFGQLSDYQKDPQYSFDFPMPFYITVIKKSTGSLPQNVEYTVRPDRNDTKLEEGLEDKLAKHTPPEEIKENMKAKQMKKFSPQEQEEALDEPENE